ncbi:DNA-directed RNA polymerase subunit delta [Bacillus sp. V59.32b]|uniref:DNA-directed RNA polymerase subunit delta n=1 Tax=Bacillus sp. V59.32b TaxID=1758642 RepID=UPI000E3E8BB4|nr:DNA-directed RNA polymerase subunit delta [Bacillus sp. V59.32b]RFU67998.1 DNA-directed RNA polymerase subunit delta [Bacillus sp. V59.32b]
MSLKKYSKEQLSEMSLLEIAYELLAEKKQPVSFKDLMAQISKLQGLSDEEINKRISQFYTDLNVDGRFTSLGENRWGLKAWYPVDQIEDEVVHVAKPKKKKKAKKAVVEDIEDEDDLDFEEEELEEDDLLDDDDDLIDIDVDEDDEEDFDEDLEEDLVDEEADLAELDDEDDEEDEEDSEDTDEEKK